MLGGRLKQPGTEVTVDFDAGGDNLPSKVILSLFLRSSLFHICVFGGPFVGADVAFHPSPVVALGLDAAWYAPFNRSAAMPPSYPLNETRDSVDLDVTVAPWPAYRPGALEPYLLAGLGALQSRPIAVVDPANRSFSYNTLADLTFGVGVRVFAGERVAMTLELRNLLYFEKTENHQVANGPIAGPGASGFADSPRNPATWYNPRTHLTNAIQLRLGVSFFVLGG